MTARRQVTTSLGLIYDTGALIAAESNDRRLWALHSRALQRGLLPVVPSGCIVEAWRGGRQPSLSRLLDGCEIEPLTEEAAKRAGSTRKGAPGSVGPIDAMVVESALRRKSAVVTSDRVDVELLARAARRRLHVIDI